MNVPLSLVAFWGLLLPAHLAYGRPPPIPTPSVLLTAVEEKGDTIAIVFTGDKDVSAISVGNSSKLMAEERFRLLSWRALIGSPVKIHVVTDLQMTKGGILILDAANSTVEITKVQYPPPAYPAAWEYFESESGTIMIRGGIPMPPSSGLTITRPFHLRL